MTKDLKYTDKVVKNIEQLIAEAKKLEEIKQEVLSLTNQFALYPELKDNG